MRDLAPVGMATVAPHETFALPPLCTAEAAALHPRQIEMPGRAMRAGGITIE